MPRTSDKSQKIVEFVRQFTQENGFAPSVREIGAAVGLRSTASVSYHLQQLQEKGLRDKYIVMVGGAPVNEAFAQQIGADYYTPDAATAAEVARDAVLAK